MKAVIIDDEPLPAKYLQELLLIHCKNVSDTTIINEPLEAIKYLENNKVDLIFIDVEMPTMTGIELLRNTKIDDTTAIIFTTAYEEYALEAFKVNAIHYLVKPIDVDELKIAVEKGFKFSKKADKSKLPKTEVIKLFDGEIYRKLDYDKIFRFQADGSYTRVFLERENFLVTKRLGEILKELKPGTFIRSHNSHIVNLKKIKGIKKTKLIISMIDDSEVPFSNSYRSNVLKSFNI